LRIVASYDLGALGPAQSEPILYYWSRYYSVPGLALWAALALAMIVSRANRTREVLLVLVPVLLVSLVWWTVARIFKPIPSDREAIGVTVLSLAVGSALLWLLGPVIASCTRRRALVLALTVTLGAALVGVVSVTDLSRQTIGLPLLLSSLAPAMVLSYAGAGWMSRRTYRPIRFALLLAAWTVALSAVALPLGFFLVSALTGTWPSEILPLLAMFLLAGAIAGACVVLISLSFLFVGLRSPLLRPRLFACLGWNPDAQVPRTE